MELLSTGELRGDSASQWKSMLKTAASRTVTQFNTDCDTIWGQIKVAKTPRDNNYDNLGTGVNITNWKNLTAADLTLFTQSGITNVRIPVGDAEMSGDWTVLDTVVDGCLAAGVGVLIDYHYYTAALTQADFVTRWRAVAAHYVTKSNRKIAFEMLNEPTGMTWIDDGQAAAITAIREVAPLNMILVAGSSWSNVRGQRIYPDANTVQVLHYYGPLAFTHQGAEWSPQYVCGVTLDPAHESDLETWATAVQSWAQTNNVKIACTELGVYTHCASLTQAEINNWLRITSSGLRKHGITALSVWEYGTGGFRINSGATWKDGIKEALALR